MRGATRGRRAADPERVFQSTRPMRGATAWRGRENGSVFISIHAPHAGRDGWCPAGTAQSTSHFNPRAPCGARPLADWAYLTAFRFQSTRPMRGATPWRTYCPARSGHFNPRAPCGARLPPNCSPVMGSVFQSTRPMRGATPASSSVGHPSQNFNPRAPCGARQVWSNDETAELVFQSTRPMRGATSGDFWEIPKDEISIHAPHAGRDGGDLGHLRLHSDFNPRAPCGARLVAQHQWELATDISIHAPHAGRDRTSHSRRFGWAYFNPRAPCGARP